MNGFNFFLKFNFSFTPPQKENYQPGSGILMYNFRIKLVNIIPNLHWRKHCSFAKYKIDYELHNRNFCKANFRFKG